MVCVCVCVCVCVYVLLETLNSRHSVLRMVDKWCLPYSSIQGNRNWQIGTADWNSDVRVDVLGFSKETLCKPRNIAQKLAGWVKNRGFYFPGCYCILISID